MLAKVAYAVKQQLGMTDQQIKCVFQAKILKYEYGQQQQILCSIRRYRDEGEAWEGIQYIEWAWPVVKQIRLDTHAVEDAIVDFLQAGGADRFSCLERRPFQSTGHPQGIPHNQFLGGAPVCRWFPDGRLWSAGTRDPPPGFPRPPTLSEIYEHKGAMQVADTDSPFVNDEELEKWRRKWLTIEMGSVPHKGYLLKEKGLQHEWIWVLTGEDTMVRRILVDSNQLLDFESDGPTWNFPIALYFTVTFFPIPHRDVYQLQMAEAFAPSAYPRAASP